MVEEGLKVTDEASTGVAEHPLLVARTHRGDEKLPAESLDQLTMPVGDVPFTCALQSTLPPTTTTGEEQITVVVDSGRKTAEILEAPWTYAFRSGEVQTVGPRGHGSIPWIDPDATQ
jgi:hypothetical protein